MKYFHLTILLVLTIGNNVLSQKTDSTNIKYHSHGVYLEILGKNPIYSTGYEFTSGKNKNNIGIGVGFTLEPNIKLMSKRYLNIYFGISPFYEFGKKWGLRTGFNIGGSWNPISYSSKLNNVLLSDRPFLMSFNTSVNVGLFYRTKNYRWQVILSAYSYSNFRQYQYSTKKEWGFVGFIPLFAGLTIKYNFKISQR